MPPSYLEAEYQTHVQYDNPHFVFKTIYMCRYTYVSIHIYEKTRKK